MTAFGVFIEGKLILLGLCSSCVSMDRFSGLQVEVCKFLHILCYEFQPNEKFDM